MAKKPVRKAVKKKVTKKAVKKVVRKAAKKAIKKKVAKKVAKKAVKKAAVKKAAKKVVKKKVAKKVAKKAVKKAVVKKAAKKVIKKAPAKRALKRKKASGPPIDPLNFPITILGIGDGGHLILSDKGESTVPPKATITWIIGPLSGVKSIDKIYDDGYAPPLFTPPAKIKNGSTDWDATINPAFEKGKRVTRSYTISYTSILPDAVSIIDSDPKIIVNP